LISAGSAQVYIEANDFGQDYEMQGEYKGEFTAKDGSLKQMGIQIRAMGSGNFVAVFLPGGLPGDGWDGITRIEAEGRSEFSEEGFSGTLADGVFSGRNAEGEEFELQKVMRTSPTEDMEPPEGSIVLFDGSNGDEWEPASGGFAGKQVSTLEDGTKALNDGFNSRRKFGDFFLHMEFRMSAMPDARGQSRCNGGLFLHDTYEIQMLETFAYLGTNSELGGVYRLYAPMMNMAYPPLSWQTWDIDFKAPVFENGEKVENARITMKWNGVLVHDDRELRGTAGYRDEEGPGKKSIHLQERGEPTMFFKNVWVIERPYNPVR
jgi:hypothetical protein